MTRVLITGMSGTGKSSTLEELGRRGHHVVDADLTAWSVERDVPDGSGVEQVWREDAMAALLADPVSGVLFVAGCASNQGGFYDRFDAVVLLSAPEAVMLERTATRDTNGFGRAVEERQRILDDLAAVEPLLRATSTAEIVTTVPLAEVVDAVEAAARSVPRTGGSRRNRGVAEGSTPVSPSSTPPTCTPRASRRRSSAGPRREPSRRRRPRHDVPRRHGRGPQPPGRPTALDRPGGRGLAAAAAHRLDRPVPGAPLRPRHRPRGDARRAERPRAPGQGPLPRFLDVPAVGHRRGAVGGARQWPAALRDRAAAVSILVPPSRPTSSLPASATAWAS